MTDSQHAQQTRVSIDPSDNTKTVYTNAFSTKFTENDLIVTFCVSSLEYDDKGSVLTVQAEQRVGMTIESARRLVDGLTQDLQEHDQLYGDAAPKE